MDPATISSIAQTINSSKIQNKREIFSKEFPEFVRLYPTLFSVCCSGTDINHLNMMIELLQHVNSNKMTTHVASVEVGQKLYDSFVKPGIDSNAK